MKAVGMVINFKKPKAKEIADEVKDWFENRGIKVVEWGENFRPDSLDATVPSPDPLSQVDLILVLGGDGTLLNTARIVSPSQIPLLGINMGYLGFLTEIDLADMFSSLEKLLAGECWMEERMMLGCGLRREGVVVDEFLALNDIVIAKGAFSRMILFDVYVDDQYIDTYSADGLIISTPTGSTAYSLSAGGPIVSPEMELMLITPICPHTLYSRPMVIGPGKNIRVVLKSQFGEVMLTVDGQHGYKLVQGDEVLVAKSLLQTRLIRLKPKTFYDILRTKLRESGGQHRV